MDNLEEFSRQQLDALIKAELEKRVKEESERIGSEYIDDLLYGTERHARAFDAHCRKIARPTVARLIPEEDLPFVPYRETICFGDGLPLVIATRHETA